MIDRSAFGMASRIMCRYTTFPSSTDITSDNSLPFLRSILVKSRLLVGYFLPLPCALDDTKQYYRNATPKWLKNSSVSSPSSFTSQTKTNSSAAINTTSKVRTTSATCTTQPAVQRRTEESAICTAPATPTWEQSLCFSASPLQLCKFLTRRASGSGCVLRMEPSRSILVTP